jgi:serine O-acetyltransferase
MPNRGRCLVELLVQLREDWEVHYRDWTLPGFRAIAVHRFGVWLKGIRFRVARKVLSRIHRMLYRYVRNHYGIELPDTTVVGRRVLIGHHGGIVIHPHAKIGDGCLIRHNVTIGAVRHDRGWEAPILGNRVQVGCGAAILGPVTVGDGARIGPNAVVITNVPAGATVFAPPPQVIHFSGWAEPSSRKTPSRTLADKAAPRRESTCRHGMGEGDDVTDHS